MMSKRAVTSTNVFVKTGILYFLLTVFLLTITLTMKPLVVHASTQYTDQESNNSFAEAQFIGRNAMAPASYVSGNTQSYRYVTGNLTGREDEDWYWLATSSSFDSYFTISNVTGTVYIDILNEQEEVINTFSYNGTASAENVFHVDIGDYGYYYIRLYHDVDITTSYYFTFGNPHYRLGTYTYSFGTQTLPAKGTWEDSINLERMPEIPAGAIGHRITVSGCSTAVCTKRYYNTTTNQRWAATNATYMKDLPVVDDSRLAQEWGIRYISASKTNQTFTPQFKIDYVYPELPANEH